MRRIAWLGLAVIFILPSPAAACSICGGGFLSRQTLREHYARAKYVAQGKLKNPKFDPNGGAGTTEFHVESVLKPDPAIGNRSPLTLPRYLPAIGAPPDYLVFCAVADGKLDPLHGVPAGPSVVDYLTAASKLGDVDPARRLAFFFAHLDSVDPVVSADAFHEFAKAPDGDIMKAKAALDPGKLRKWLADPKTPSDRLGVFALMLGLCGNKEDAARFANDLAAQLPAERVRENFSGFLAALTLLDPASGWNVVKSVLTDPKRPFDQRLSAVGTVRFFQATRPEESRAHVLTCYRGVIAKGDLADLAIDDLRRWGWWDLTADVIAQFDKPTHAATIIRKGIIRYALQAPGEEAKQFVAQTRAKQPKLVADVEETLKLFEPIK
jgi:hypothetical protein